MQLSPNKDLPDPDLLAVVEAQASNPVRWNALVFFGNNPIMHTHADVIAQSVGWNPKAVEKELDGLIQIGILKARQTGCQLTYELVSDSSVRNAVIRFAHRSAFD